MNSNVSLQLFVGILQTRINSCYCKALSDKLIPICVPSSPLAFPNGRQWWVVSVVILNLVKKKKYPDLRVSLCDLCLYS